WQGKGVRRVRRMLQWAGSERTFAGEETQKKRRGCVAALGCRGVPRLFLAPCGSVAGRGLGGRPGAEALVKEVGDGFAGGLGEESAGAVAGALEDFQFDFRAGGLELLVEQLALVQGHERVLVAVHDEEGWDGLAQVRH